MRKRRVKFETGFYWNRSNINRYFLTYCENPASSDSEGLIRIHNFDERGVWPGYMTRADKLTKFDPEKDMDRLKPEVAEKVRQRLEELARDGK